MIEDHKIDSDNLDATVIGLAIRLAFLGVFYFCRYQSFVHFSKP